MLRELKGVRGLEGEKRSALTICVDILRIAQIAQNGARKTRIVYWGNLNWRIVEHYLEKLKDWDLIKEDSGLFKTTQRGQGIVEYFYKIDKLLTAKNNNSL
jgi:predicted transcriptional regulator